MPHGGPDWGTTGPLGTVFTMEDMGELAARLGSIVTYDRRGNVIFLDSFEGGLGKWRPWQSAAGHNVSISNDRVEYGTASAKLTTAGPGDMWIERNQTFPTISKLGVEFSFSLGLEAGVFQVSEIHLEITTYDEKNHSWINVQWVSTPVAGAGVGKWQYRGTDHLWHDLGITSWFDTAHWFYTFNTVKLVFDLATTKFTRLLVNHNWYDIANLDYDRLPPGGAPQLTVNIGIIRVGVPAATMYVGHAIFTQNEPDNPA